MIAYNLSRTKCVKTPETIKTDIYITSLLKTASLPNYITIGSFFFIKHLLLQIIPISQFFNNILKASSIFNLNILPHS